MGTSLYQARGETYPGPAGFLDVFPSLGNCDVEAVRIPDLLTDLLYLSLVPLVFQAGSIEVRGSYVATPALSCHKDTAQELAASARSEPLSWS